MRRRRSSGVSPGGASGSIVGVWKSRSKSSTGSGLTTSSGMRRVGRTGRRCRSRRRRVLVADVFATMLGRGDDVWHEVRDPRGYAFRAVTNAARMLGRSRARRRTRETRWWAATSGAELISDLAVIDALSSLSIRQRAVLFLTYWEDLDVAAVGRRLGISDGSVKRHLARSRATTTTRHSSRTSAAGSSCPPERSRWVSPATNCSGLTATPCGIAPPAPNRSRSVKRSAPPGSSRWLSDRIP